MIKQNAVAPLLLVMTISAGLTIDGLGLQRWVKLPIRHPAYRVKKVKASYQILEKQTENGLTPTPTATPTPTPTKIQKKTEKPTPDEVKTYILEVFGEKAGKEAIKLVGECENSTFDQSRTNHNRNGSIDYGIFQINSIHTKKRGRKFIYDWRENVKVAKQIYDEQGWRPWSCAYVLGVKPFYKK